MKKPVRKTKAELDAAVAKAKPKQVVREQHIKSGSISEITDMFSAFAKKHNVLLKDVRLIQGSWGRAYLQTKTTETPGEIRTRIKHADDRRYSNALYKYQQWEYAETQAQRQAEAAARTLAQYNTKSQCCPSNCCCRRGK